MVMGKMRWEEQWYMYILLRLLTKISHDISTKLWHSPKKILIRSQIVCTSKRNLELSPKMQTICKQNETYYGNANLVRATQKWWWKTILQCFWEWMQSFFGRTQQFYERTLSFSWDTNRSASKLKVSVTLYVDGPIWTYQSFSGKCTHFVSARKCTEI